jgi:hypothetical protein
VIKIEECQAAIDIATITTVIIIALAAEVILRIVIAVEAAAEVGAENGDISIMTTTIIITIADEVLAEVTVVIAVGRKMRKEAGAEAEKRNHEKATETVLAARALVPTMEKDPQVTTKQRSADHLRDVVVGTMTRKQKKLKACHHPERISSCKILPYLRRITADLTPFNVQSQSGVVDNIKTLC